MIRRSMSMGILVWGGEGSSNDNHGGRGEAYPVAVWAVWPTIQNWMIYRHVFSVPSDNLHYISSLSVLVRCSALFR